MGRAHQTKTNQSDFFVIFNHPHPHPHPKSPTNLTTQHPKTNPTTLATLNLTHAAKMKDSGQSKVHQCAQQFGYLLVPDLKLLAQEAKKKHPQLKEACERATVRVTSVDPASLSCEPAEFLRVAEEFWKPLLSALDGKGARLTALSLGALQKLLSHGLLLPSHIPAVVNAVAKLKEQDEAVQLKVLQCLMLLYSSGEYELGSAQMPMVFSVAFTMHLSRSNTVQSTAAATITQITLAQFHRLRNAKNAPEGEVDTTFATAKTAFLLLKDLCTLASGEPGQFIKIVGEVPKIFIFDLLYTVMKDHSDVMSAHPSFVTLVREDLSLVLAQSMKSATDLQSIVRMHRLITVTLQRFPTELVKQQELLISLMAGALDQPECPIWHKLSILASWRELCENYSYLKKMYSRFDHSSKHSKLFESLCSSVCGLVKKIPPSVFQASTNGERLTIHKMLQAKSEDELAIRTTEMLMMLVEVIVAICKSLSKLVEIEGRPLTDAERANNVEEQTGEHLAIHMLNSVWSLVLTACSVLLDKTSSEELIEETLRCFKLFTHACGKAGLPNARDSFIMAINKFTLPQQGTLSPKNTQVVRVLFDIANGLGGVLDSSWYILLANFQQLNIILSSGAEQANQADIPLIRTLLDNIFEGTLYFEHDALLSMVNALCQLSVEAMAASQPASPTGTRYTCSPYGLQRLADVSVANVGRLHMFWQSVCDHLAWLVKKAQNEVLRKAAVEAASQIILAYFKKYRQIAGHPTSPTSDDAAKPAQQPTWKDDTEVFMQMQPKVVDCLRLMRDTDKTDVRMLCLNLIFTVIERAGQELTPESWKTVLSMLASSSQYPAEVNLGFKSVELVYSDFMPILDHEGLHALISCVGQFSQQTATPNKTNTNLSAIQQGLLSIADYCSSVTNVSETHWNALFIQLRDVATDSRPDVRHSGMKTLFNALVTHGSTLPPACWNALFWDVLLKVLDNVHASSLAAEHGSQELQPRYILHHSRNTPAKQWYETRCIVIDGVVRIVKVFYTVACKGVNKIDDVLTRLAVHLAKACMHSTDEVANMGLRSLQDLLVDLSCIPEANDSHLSVLWDVAWNTWEKIADTTTASAGGDPPASTTVLTTMTEGLADMYMQSSEPKNLSLRKHIGKHASRILPMLDKVCGLSSVPRYWLL